MFFLLQKYFLYNKQPWYFKNISYYYYVASGFQLFFFIKPFSYKYLLPNMDNIFYFDIFCSSNTKKKKCYLIGHKWFDKPIEVKCVHLYLCIFCYSLLQCRITEQFILLLVIIGLKIFLSVGTHTLFLF